LSGALTERNGESEKLGGIKFKDKFGGRRDPWLKNEVFKRGQFSSLQITGGGEEESTVLRERGGTGIEGGGEEEISEGKGTELNLK